MRNIARKFAAPEQDTAPPRRQQRSKSGESIDAAPIAYLPGAAIRPKMKMQRRPGLY